MSKEQVLITGVCGFIGFHTAIKFMEEGHIVLGIDEINNHYDILLKKKRLEFLKKNFSDKFYFKKLNIYNKKKVDKIIKNKKFKIIVNLAARPGVRSSVLNPWIYYKTNTLGVLNLLDSIKKYVPEALLIQASTSSVYGDRKGQFSESDRVDYLLSPYAASKKSSEEICYTYHYLYKLNIIIFRFFTVYGEYGRPDMSYFKFIKWIDEGKKLKLFGDGTQERDFTYVYDIVNAIYSAKGLKGYDIINLGNDNPITINYLIKLIEYRLNRKAIIKSYERHPADVIKTWADIKKAEKILKWKPKISIEKGIEKVVNWYISNKEWLSKIKVS